MYYPILRGRQNELLAIKELLKESKLSEKIIPIIEPVKLSPTLVNSLKEYITDEEDLYQAVIKNEAYQNIPREEVFKYLK